MGCLSTSLNNLQFPLSVFYTSQHISLSPPWSVLFLSILFFYAISKGVVVFWVFFTFPFWYFIVSVKKCNRFLMIHVNINEPIRTMSQNNPLHLQPVSWNLSPLLGVLPGRSRVLSGKADASQQADCLQGLPWSGLFMICFWDPGKMFSVSSWKGWFW